MADASDQIHHRQCSDWYLQMLPIAESARHTSEEDAETAREGDVADPVRHRASIHMPKEVSEADDGPLPPRLPRRPHRR